MKRIVSLLLSVLIVFSMFLFVEAKSSSSSSKNPSVKLDLIVVDLYIDGTETLTATTNPKGQKVTWKSSNTKVATVNSSGKITAKSIGKCKITASFKYKDKTYSASCPVNVKYPTISLSCTSKTVYYGFKYTLSARVWGKSSKIVWKSSNTKVATVNSKGEITPKAEGTCIISATANGVRANCKITVKYLHYKVKLNVNGSDVKKSSNFISTFDCIYGKKTVIPKNCVTKKGCRFSGWYDKKNKFNISDGANIGNMSWVKDGATITLYAVWDELTTTSVYTTTVYTIKPTKEPVTKPDTTG